MEAFKKIALTPTRKIIASRMTEAKQTVPHFRLVVDIGMDRLMTLLQELRQYDSTQGLSLNDLLVKSCAGALADVPAVNVQWVGGAIHQFSAADISVVVASDNGLSTPIVRDAGAKSIWDIARELRDFSSRAAKGALRMSEISGGSFSISNLGMYGVDRFDAVINLPQCAILAVGASKLRPVVFADGVVRAANVMTATLSCDHRAIDGVTGAMFLSALQRRIEQPEHLRCPPNRGESVAP